MIVSSTLSSIYSVGLLAVDRFLYIVYGIKYCKWISTIRVRVVIGLTWLMGKSLLQPFSALLQFGVFSGDYRVFAPLRMVFRHFGWQSVLVHCSGAQSSDHLHGLHGNHPNHHCFGALLYHFVSRLGEHQADSVLHLHGDHDFRADGGAGASADVQRDCGGANEADEAEIAGQETVANQGAQQVESCENRPVHHVQFSSHLVPLLFRLYSLRGGGLQPGRRFANVQNPAAFNCQPSDYFRVRQQPDQPPDLCLVA